MAIQYDIGEFDESKFDVLAFIFDTPLPLHAHKFSIYLCFKILNLR